MSDEKKEKIKKPKLTLLERKFLRAYFKNGMNATQAVYDAGKKYKDRETAAVAGAHLKKKLQPLIDLWLDEQGLSEEKLKMKGLDLLNAKTTKHFAYEGEIFDSRDYEDNATQTKALELMMKVKGMVQPDKVEMTPPAFNLTILPPGTEPEKKESDNNNG